MSTDELQAALREIERLKAALREAARYEQGEPEGWVAPDDVAPILHRPDQHDAGLFLPCLAGVCVPLYRRVTEGEEG